MERGIRNTFTKNERLCKRGLIREIFEKGVVFNTSLFRVIRITTGGLPSPAQIVFSVPKRCFKSAVARNLIKRRMREAYRLRKQVLYEFLLSNDIQIAFIVVYRNDSIPEYLSVENSMDELLEKMINRLKKERV